MRYLLVIILGTLCSCVPTKSTSVIYGDNYDKNTDLTTVTILPYGQVKIPGKWNKTDYNSSSRQHFFKGTDSVTFAVGLNPWDKYEFYKPEMTPNQFVKAYYEWDSNYLQEQTNGLLRIIKEDKNRNFIIWNLKKEPSLDSYFLFGLKNKIVVNLYVTTKKWDERKITELLERTYSM